MSNKPRPVNKTGPAPSTPVPAPAPMPPITIEPVAPQDELDAILAKDNGEVLEIFEAPAELPKAVVAVVATKTDDPPYAVTMDRDGKRSDA